MDHTPLASRMRPQTLEDVVGQAHLLGKNQRETDHVNRDALLVRSRCIGK